MKDERISSFCESPSDRRENVLFASSSLHSTGFNADGQFHLGGFTKARQIGKIRALQNFPYHSKPALETSPLPLSNSIEDASHQDEAIA